MNGKTISTPIVLILLFSFLPHLGTSVSASTEVQLGVKAGDWIKLNYTVTGSTSGMLVPTWMRIEFLSVDAAQASATMRMTMHMSNGTEQNQTGTVSLTGGAANGTVVFSGIIIPANLKVGDDTFMVGYGNVTIAGETTRTYVGATRSVVYTNFSQQGNQLSFYWDRQTGVLVEAHITSGSITATITVIETNMWQPQLFRIPIDPIVFFTLIVVIILIVAASLAIRKKKKRPEQTPSTNTSPA
jgi:hypothetical protein